MGIETILGMIPKGGKYAKSVVNFVHKAPENWSKFTEAIKQITDLLKIGRLRLDGKQKTIFETNKNILKNHEKVVKVELKDANKFFENLLPSVTKKYPPFNVSKEDFTKGWTPTLVERSKARDIYKELEPPKVKYTQEMEAIDDELGELTYGDKYEHLSEAERAFVFKKLQEKMNQLITAGKEDLTTLSLGTINKRKHVIQKKIQEIIDNPNIKGTVDKGPKRDMIEAISKSERSGLENAQNIIKRRNAKKKYGDKFPRLDPENDAFIITGLDAAGNPNKIGRFTGKFGATKNPITGELTRKEGTSYWDMWDAKKNQIRKQGEEVWHETVDAEGKTIMSNPDYKVTTKNMDIWNELYNETNISELSKRGFKLQDIDMLMKGRAVKNYINTRYTDDIPEFEKSSSSQISDIMEDLYLRGDDIYKMSIEEWTKKIPEYFAEGGRTGFRNPGLVTKGIEKGMQLKRLLAEGGIFAALIAAMEAGTIGLDEALKMLGKQESDVYKPSDFYRLWKNYQSKKEFLKRNKARKTRGGPEMQEDYYSGYYKEHMPELTWHEMKGEEKSSSSEKMRDYVYPTEKRNEHATGGVSNLFRERQGYRSAGKVIDLVKGARWLIKQLKSVLDDMIYGSGDVKSIFSKMPEAEKVKIFKQTESAIKSLESGGPIPDEILTSLRNDARFKGLTVSTKADKDFIEMYEVVVGKPTKGTGEKIIEGKVIEAQPKVKEKSIFSMTKEEKAARLKKYQEESGIKLSYADKEKRLIPEGMTAESIDEAIKIGNAEREKVELFAFMNELPKDLQHKVGLLPVEQQLPLLRKFKEAFDATKTGGVEGGIDILQKQWLKDFTPKGQPHATGGFIDGYATGGVSNLFRQRQGFRTGTITKLPEFLKFVEKLFIKASNEIRLGKGLFKSLGDRDKWVQHNNLLRKMDEWQKTKTLPEGMEQYFGIDAEKAFIEAQAKATRLGKKGPNWKEQEVKAQQTERTMDDLVEQAYEEIKGGSGFSGDYKYDADILASEIATTGGKIYDDLAAVEKAGIYELAYKRVIKDLKARMDFKKDLKDVEQKIELQMFDPKGKKPNAEGGLIDGYATGGVSNLFRSR